MVTAVMGKVGTQPRSRVTALYWFSRCANLLEDIPKRPNIVLILETKFPVPLDLHKRFIRLMTTMITL